MNEVRPLPAGDCLVTGATGLVGNNVVRQLVAAGRRVRVLVRTGGSEADRVFAGLPVIRCYGSVDDDDALRIAAEGCGAIIHSAAMVHSGWWHLDAMRRTNVDGTRTVARAARLVGARMVHVSSVDAGGLRSDGAPADEETPAGGMLECPYVVTKREAEEALREEIDRGLDAVIVNPVYMLGPWDWKPSSGRMLLIVGSGRGLFAPPGSNDFVDVRDVAAGILAALERGRVGRRYILGGHPLSYLDAWRTFATVAGCRPPRGIAPVPLARFAGRVGDLAALLLRREPDLNSAAVGMSLLAHNFSCTRARKELGYAFRDFESTVRDAWAWFMSHGYIGESRQRSAAAR